MTYKYYEVVLEVLEKNDIDEEEVELWISYVLREGLPDSIEAHVLGITETDENENY